MGGKLGESSIGTWKLGMQGEREWWEISKSEIEQWSTFLVDFSNKVYLKCYVIYNNSFSESEKKVIMYTNPRDLCKSIITEDMS